MTEENETDDNYFTLIFGEPALLKGDSDWPTTY